MKNSDFFSQPTSSIYLFRKYVWGGSWIRIWAFNWRCIRLFYASFFSFFLFLSFIINHTPQRHCVNLVLFFNNAFGAAQIHHRVVASLPAELHTTHLRQFAHNAGHRSQLYRSTFAYNSPQSHFFIHNAELHRSASMHTTPSRTFPLQYSPLRSATIPFRKLSQPIYKTVIVEFLFEYVDTGLWGHFKISFIEITAF